jgi:hypothetical protein
MVDNYNFMEIIIDEEEEILLASELYLFSTGIIMLPDHMVKGPHIQFKHELGTIVVMRHQPWRK